jgi:hypothetical protein
MDIRLIRVRIVVRQQDGLKGLGALEAPGYAPDSGEQLNDAEPPTVGGAPR